MMTAIPEAAMVIVLELIGVGDGRSNELAQRMTFRDRPLPDPSMTSSIGA
jgi:hypothetical protein